MASLTRISIGYSSTIQGRLRFLTVLAALLGVTPTNTAIAQQSNENQAVDIEESEGDEEVRPVIELGRFHIKDLRPTRNETAKVSFIMHLALVPTIDQQTLKQLEHWTHRMRNQVIIAVRIAETRDFLEPDLNRFRKSISLRVNRALKVALVSDVLFTEFTFTTN